jgi:hypothetical protein
MNEERSEKAPGASLPELTLERYRLGEFSRDEAERIERLLSRDEGLRQRLLAIDRSDEEFRERHPSGWLAHAVVERAAGGGATRRGRVAAWAVPAAVAVSVSFLLLRAGLWAPPSPVPLEAPAADSGGERPKGAPVGLVIYRSTESGSETLSDNDFVREGDLIRVAYRAAEPGYGTILSIDGRGVLTVHLPVDGERAVALEPAKTVLLDHAFELDDAPEGEIFFLVAGKSPFELAVAKDAVRRAASESAPSSLAPLRLPPPLHYVTLSLRKETRP